MQHRTIVLSASLALALLFSPSLARAQYQVTNFTESAAIWVMSSKVPILLVHSPDSSCRAACIGTTTPLTCIHKRDISDPAFNAAVVRPV
jgi:hypothetical protein